MRTADQMKDKHLKACTSFFNKENKEKEKELKKANKYIRKLELEIELL
jgi:hypothetical protein